MMPLTACTMGNSNGNVRIQVQEYSVAVQQQAAKELQSQGPACATDTVQPGCSASKRLITDYGTLRKKVRTLNGS